MTPLNPGPARTDGGIQSRRDETEIIRALKYALDEIGAHNDLDRAASTGRTLLIAAFHKVVRDISLGLSAASISRSIDDFIDTVAKLEKANEDLIEASAIQIKEYGLEIERLEAEAEKKSSRPANHRTDRDVEEAIAWRCKMWQDTQNILSGTEANDFIGLTARLDEFKEKLRLIKQGVHIEEGKGIDTQKNEYRRKVELIESTISVQTVLADKLSSEMNRLRAYLDAKRTYAEGLPDELFVKPKGIK